MSEAKFYPIDPLDAYPEPVGTADKLEHVDGAVFAHLNGKRAKLAGVQSLAFLIEQLQTIRANVFAAAPQPPAIGGEPEVLAWMFKQHDQSPFGKPSQHIAFSSEELTEVREGLVGIGIPREEYFDWQALVDRSHVTRLQAKIEDLNQSLSRARRAHASSQGILQAEVERLNRKCQNADLALAAQTSNRDKALARTAELERLLRKQAEHIVILAENTLSYSSGIGSPIKTKEVNDAV